MWTRAAGPALLALLTLCSPAPAAAQGIEVAGTRALGMSGAFVAVADDASAAYWNPAGLATGALFSAVIDGGAYETGEVPTRPDGVDGGLRGHQLLIAAATLPVAVSYLQLASVGATPGTAADPARVSALTTHQLGLTLVQTIVQGLVVAGSLKYVRGSYGAALVPTSEAAGLEDLLEVADRLDQVGSNAFDADLGVMGTVGTWRLGLVARNLVAPEFHPRGGGPPGRLERQVRAGVAWLPSARLVLAADADLTTADLPSGERRNVAAGAETWWLERRFALRAGVRASTVGAVRPVAAVGASAALWKALMADAQWTVGGARADAGWGLAGRVVF
jgi:hypothetical protein